MKKLLELKQYIIVFLAIVIAISSTVAYYFKAEAATSSEPGYKFSRPSKQDTEKIYSWVSKSGKLQEGITEMKGFGKNLKLNESKSHIMCAEKDGELAYFVYYPVIGAVEKDSKYIVIF